MIGLATFSLLAVCPYPAADLSAPQSPPSEAAGLMAGIFSADSGVNLPKQAGPWIRPDAPRHITEETIFDYMDGAGELYLAYRFEHLDVYEYSAPDQSLGEIRVELYWMKGSDDAFGLLSNDWGGEPIDLGGRAGSPAQAAAQMSAHAARDLYTAVPPHAALYGGGLLRFWSGNLYGRVMASRESRDARAQVLAIAASIVEGRPGNDHPPEILSRIQVRWDQRFVLRRDRTCFFRSHYVLNSAYYLAPDDILGLGPEVDASISEYRPAAAGGPPVRLVQVVYPSADAAAAALRIFLKSYVPGPVSLAAERSAPGSAKAESSWVGWAAKDRTLAIVLDAPREAEAKELASAALAALLHQ